LLFLVLIVGGGLVVAAAATSGRLHRDVADVLPFIRHPELVGTLDLSGQLTASNLSVMQKPPTVEFGGSCRTYSDRTSWDLTAKLPDASTFSLKFSLPPDEGGAGTYRTSKLILSANADNSQQSSSWAGAPGTAASLTLTPAGGGSLVFSRLAPGDVGGRPLSGRASWTCSVA
jgi:hypothetical protein